MKIKALKSIQSSIVVMEKDDVREIELDEYTLKNWTENGLIEEVKSGRKKAPETTDEIPVNTDENQ
jgi:hypothetical protein